MNILSFEKPLYDIEAKIEELKNLGADQKLAITPEIKKLNEKLEQMRKEIYGNLSSWQRVQIARHPDRPYSMDYIKMILTDFTELHGDRLFADDSAIIGGFAKLEQHKVMVIGHQKGRDTKENIMRNFGCAHPEGYRKAIRLMELAAKFHLPVIVFIDTPGAYPGLGAEERGQAQAIAENLKNMSRVKTPIIATVIGEGGSGGALGIGVADKVLILEHAYYSVISPEGCASILWRNAVKAPEAAEVLKMTGEHLIKFGVVDDIIPEPLGGAHKDPEICAASLKKSLLKNLQSLLSLSQEDLIDSRYEKFRKIGVFAKAANSSS
ncbi:MAG TPA: acetyl-CoA carboxylase carboxyltransferase subunit alpha [Candidatus Omnitrophota bacterium]|mgnify:CR=1 FL=1|nr:acetyl-CoA carboxylase carboxyltransferase subunit alpha [Candidatus Omnitrophota bacterium]HPN88868.1 acetyl-CoA carboxylase carboxyltransferase subunit alpha [Candidatus Omnitrophota bacterium]